MQDGPQGNHPSGTPSSGVPPFSEEGPPQRPWLASFSSLRSRNFRLFITGTLVAFLALQMQQLAQNYLVFQLTGLATSIGYVSAALGFAILFCSLVGGIAADRLPKRNLLIIGQLGIGLFALLIGVLVSLGVIEVWHIILTSVAVGIIAGLTQPARQAYVPDLVEGHNLINALALTSGVMNMARIGGPALAGVIIGAFGVAPAFYSKAAAYTIFVLLLLMIPIRGEVDRQMRAGRSMLADALDGVRYLRSDRTVRELLIMGVVPVVLAMPYVNFLPVFQERVFGVGPAELGLMMSMVGGGAVVGSMVVASLGEYRYKGRVLLGSGVLFGVSLMLFCAVAGPGTFGVSLGLLAATGATGTAFMSLNNALVLSLTPPHMRGRVTGLFMTTFGLQPLGALPIGALSDVIGAPLTLGSFAAVTALLFLAASIFRPNLRRL